MQNDLAQKDPLLGAGLYESPIGGAPASATPDKDPIG